MAPSPSLVLLTARYVVSLHIRALPGPCELVASAAINLSLSFTPGPTLAIGSSRAPQFIPVHVRNPYPVHCRVACCSTSLRALRYYVRATSTFSSCLSIEVCPRRYYMSCIL
ncbi:hypothetical protein C8R47DRAFT_1085447 [Mycena vitilis]|nr:hypothetical protein C8R47DRAFT_1085447 [Mycena vitilis]